MNTKLIKILLAGAVVALVGNSKALAVPFAGTIAFDGTVTLDNPIMTAKKITAYNNVKVSNGTQTGAYVGTDGLAVTMQTLTFLPALAPDPVIKLWDFWNLAATVEYSFDLYGPITVTKVGGTIPTLTLEGSGWANITGFDPTLGQWDLTTQGRSAKLSFSSYTVVPDGGTTALLLGLGLLSVGLAVRRSKSARA